MKIKWFSKPIDLLSIFLVMSLMFLNLADYFFTLYYLEHGAVELNPVMRLVVQQGPYVFLVVKYVILMLGVFVIMAHPKVDIKTRRFVLLFPWHMYVILLCHQVALLFLF